MKKIRYERDWSIDFHRDTKGIISEEEALKRFEMQKDIAVVVENGDDVRVLRIVFHPGCFCAHVYFLNASLQLQQHLGFETSKKDPTQLFMNFKHILFYDWMDGVEQDAGYHIAHFSEDGKAMEEMGRDGFHSIERTIHLAKAGLRLHYEPIPSFGEWDSVMRFSRRLPFDQDMRKPGQLRTSSFPSDIQLAPIEEFPTDPLKREQIKQTLLRELAALSPMPDDETLCKMEDEDRFALLEKYEKVMKDLYPLADESCIQPVLNSFGYVDPHGSVYWAGVNLWASLRGEVEPSVFENTIRQALHSEVPAKRLWATKMIWKLWDPKYVDMIWSVLEDPMELIRESAVETLETFNNPEALPWLEPMKKDPSERVRRAVAHAIKELKITNAGQLHE